MGSEWSRRRFLKGAGAGALGLMALGGAGLTPAAAGTLSRTRARGVARALSAPCDPGNRAKLGVFAEPEAPQHGFFGAFMNFEDQVYAQDYTLGVDIYRSYRSWGQRIFNRTIKEVVNPAKTLYKTPDLYLSFHSFLDSKGNNPVPWSEITAGLHDDVIDSWADELHLLEGAHAYICFHHEMENEEDTYPDGCGTPDEFQAAYWYFRQRIESPLFNGVPNLTWVITFMRNTFPPPLKHGGPDRWWPAGSPYAEIADDHLVGVDIYNRNTCHYKGWRSFVELVDTAHQFSLDKGRNFFIGECGSVEGNACEGSGQLGIDKAQWFADALTEMQSSSWSNLEAMCYSNVTGFMGGDYVIDTSPESLAAFASLANDCLFTG
jgi:hypothetical protein